MPGADIAMVITSFTNGDGISFSFKHDDVKYVSESTDPALIRRALRIIHVPIEREMYVMAYFPDRTPLSLRCVPDAINDEYLEIVVSARGSINIWASNGVDLERFKRRQHQITQAMPKSKALDGRRYVYNAGWLAARLLVGMPIIITGSLIVHEFDSSVPEQYITGKSCVRLMYVPHPDGMILYSLKCTAIVNTPDISKYNISARWVKVARNRK